VVAALAQALPDFGSSARQRARPQESAGVAFGAHVGGFLAGLILIRLFLPDRRR
jgi:membrane associated rhomboid family serine protease